MELYLMDATKIVVSPTYPALNCFTVHKIQSSSFIPNFRDPRPLQTENTKSPPQFRELLNIYQLNIYQFASRDGTQFLKGYVKTKK